MVHTRAHTRAPRAHEHTWHTQTQSRARTLANMRNRAVMSHRTLRPAFRGRRLPPPSPLPLGPGSRCRPARETRSRRGRQRSAGCADQSGRRGRKGRQKALKTPPLRTSQTSRRSPARQSRRSPARQALGGRGSLGGRRRSRPSPRAADAATLGSSRPAAAPATDAATLGSSSRPAAAPAPATLGRVATPAGISRPGAAATLGSSRPRAAAALGSSRPRSIGIGVRRPASCAAGAAIGPCVRVTIAGTKIARAQRRRRGSGRTCQRCSAHCSSNCSARKRLERPRCWRTEMGATEARRKQRRRPPCLSLRAMMARMRRHEAACIAFYLWSCQGYGVCHVCFGAGPGVPWEHSLLSARRRGSQARSKGGRPAEVGHISCQGWVLSA